MLWVIFALGAAFTAALMPLLQEHHKVDGLVLAFWVKAVSVIIALPLALYWGLPEQPMFYVLIAVTGVMYSISDVIYYRAAAEVGAGVLTRLLPASVIGTFFLWFIVDPSLLDKYASQPLVSLGILASLLLAAYFAMQLKKCEVSLKAVRIIWPLLAAAAIGPLFAKPALSMAEQPQVIAAYMLVQGVIMMLCWSGYWLLRRPTTWDTVISLQAIKVGAVIGIASGICVVLKCYAYIFADNPAYPNILIFTDSVWELLLYKIMGRPNNSNVSAGLGIVVAATALVFFRGLAQ